MPPPCSPTGLGISVKNPQLSDVTPWRQHVEQHEREWNEGNHDGEAAEPDDRMREQPAPAIPRHRTLRGRYDGHSVGRRCRWRPIDQMNIREIDVDDEREHEQHEPDFYQRVQVEVIRSLGELVGEDG